MKTRRSVRKRGGKQQEVAGNKAGNKKKPKPNSDDSDKEEFLLLEQNHDEESSSSSEEEGGVAEGGGRRGEGGAVADRSMRADLKALEKELAKERVLRQKAEKLLEERPPENAVRALEAALATAKAKQLTAEAAAATAESKRLAAEAAAAAAASRETVAETNREAATERSAAAADRAAVAERNAAAAEDKRLTKEAEAVTRKSEADLLTATKKEETAASEAKKAASEAKKVAAELELQRLKNEAKENVPSVSAGKVAVVTANTDGKIAIARHAALLRQEEAKIKAGEKEKKKVEANNYLSGLGLGIGGALTSGVAGVMNNNQQTMQAVQAAFANRVGLPIAPFVSPHLAPSNLAQVQPPSFPTLEQQHFLSSVPPPGPQHGPPPRQHHSSTPPRPHPSPTPTP